MNHNATANLANQDHAHVWHPFTPMRQWRDQPPLVIERGEGFELIDTQGKRYIDASSSIWANVHGHRVPYIDQAIRDQLDKIAHTTLLGLASPPSIELAARLCRITPGRLNKVFYSDSGATALELAFKMAVGYWHHTGKPEKNRFIGLQEAYHGDTTGSMSVGYCQAFHRPFLPMVFEVTSVANPNPAHPPEGEGLRGKGAKGLREEEVSNTASSHSAPQPLSPSAPSSSGKGLRGKGAKGLSEGKQTSSHSAPQPLSPSAPSSPWPSEDEQLAQALKDHCLQQLEQRLERDAEHTAAVVIEPIMQGAAGMVAQPPGFVREVARLAKRYDTLLIADEVATGLGRTGQMFACDHETDEQFTGPDIMCLAKGLSAGYLPLAATLCTDQIEQAFTGEIGELKTLFHGHTYTGNALACAAALACLDLFEAPLGGGAWTATPPQAAALHKDEPPLIAHTRDNAALIHRKLQVLHDSPHVLDVRQRGLMVGIELCEDRHAPGGPKPLDFTQRTAYRLCERMRTPSRSDLSPILARPLGDVLILMPAPAMPGSTLEQMLETVTHTLLEWPVE